MSKRVSNAAILATIFVGVMYATPAQAQATRTWVSGVGDDANPCSRTAPCKTFAGAISKTAPQGEINVLDPGGFGGVTITKPITISAEGAEAGVLVSGGANGVLINVDPVAFPNAEVTLRGLDFEGLGTGLNGIRIISATRVVVDKCIIHHFSTNGIHLNGPAGARVMVKDSIITNNNVGVNINGAAGAAVTAIVMNTSIDNHLGSSINVVAGGTLVLGGSKLTGSATNVNNAGTFTSFGDNAIQAVGTPTNTIVLR